MNKKIKVTILFIILIVLLFSSVYFKTDAFAEIKNDDLKVTIKTNFETLYDNDQGIIYLMIENTSEKLIELKSITPILPKQNFKKSKSEFDIEPDTESKKDEIIPVPANRTIKISYKISTEKTITPRNDSIFFDIELEDGSNKLVMIDVKLAVTASNDIFSILGISSFMLLPGIVFIVIFISILKLRKIELDTSIIGSKNVEFWIASISISLFISFIYSKSEMLTSLSIYKLVIISIILLVISALKSKVICNSILFENKLDNIFDKILTNSYNFEREKVIDIISKKAVRSIGIFGAIYISISMIKQKNFSQRNIFKTYGLTDILSVWVFSFIAAIVAASVFIDYKKWHEKQTTFSEILEKDVHKPIDVIRKLANIQDTTNLETVMKENSDSDSTWFILQEKPDYVIISPSIVIYKKKEKVIKINELNIENVSEILKSVRADKISLKWNKEKKLLKVLKENGEPVGFKRTNKSAKLVEIE